MKKLYRKGTVHPSPPTISDHLSFLPVAILALTTALSPQDREVLAYLLSCSNPSANLSKHHKTTHKSNAGAGGGGDHPPVFGCNCFRCYMSYWVRWDSSPNREVIHEIIDQFEDWLEKNKGLKNKKDKKKRGFHNDSSELTRSELSLGKNESCESESVEEITGSSGDGGGGGGVEIYDDGTEKGSVRKFVSYIGERFWGVWGQ